MNAALLYAIIAGAAVLLIAAVVVAAIFLWRRQLRRSLIGLTGRREALRAAYRALEAVFTSLAEADSDELAAFALDAGSVHRKALEELHYRMRLQAEELADIALPKKLWHAADLLGSAAGTMAVETGRVGQATTAEAVLDELGKVDIPLITSVLRPADEEVDRLLVEHKIADPAVYGGGMYI